MGKVLLFSMLLVGGLVLSQVLPAAVGPAYANAVPWLAFATMVALSFIMIHVGLEFDIDKSNVRQYGWDYIVAATAAAFPWLFCCAYFIFVMLPSSSWGSGQAWTEALLASRFSAPTSAGVLFSMLAAAGLAGTWLFRKARVLAIFDDLDTVLLMIPLKMLIVGPRWQLAVIVGVMAVLLWVAWRFLHSVKLPTHWRAVLLYSVLIAGASWGIHALSLMIDAAVPIHLEVLLPAFVLGCVLKQPGAAAGQHAAGEPAAPGAGHHEPGGGEARASAVISAVFMLLVGLSMPPLGDPAASGGAGGAPVGAVAASVEAGSGAAVPAAGAPASVAGSGPSPEGQAGRPKFDAEYLATHTPPMGWGEIIMHVVFVTLLSNLGKMFPAMCYRREANQRTRLALAIGMWPRGEVGAGVLVVSLGYGISGPIVTVALLSLAVNLVLTGVFIAMIKVLIGFKPGTHA